MIRFILFSASMQSITTSIESRPTSSRVFSELPQDMKPAIHINRKKQFLDKLPAKFTSHAYFELAKSLSI